MTSNAYLFDETDHGSASETVPVERGLEAGRDGLRGVGGRLIHSRQKIFTSMVISQDWRATNDDDEHYIYAMAL